MPFLILVREITAYTLRAQRATEKRAVCSGPGLGHPWCSTNTLPAKIIHLQTSDSPESPLLSLAKKRLHRKFLLGFRLSEALGSHMMGSLGRSRPGITCLSREKAAVPPGLFSYPQRRASAFLPSQFG